MEPPGTHETLGSSSGNKRGKEGGVGKEEEAGRRRQRKYNRDGREGIGRENKEEMLSHKPGMVAHTRNPRIQKVTL